MMTPVLQAPPRLARTSRAAERFGASSETADRFFSANAERIASACQSMARCFQQGGRLLVCGDGAQRSDVAHVVVEFVHPVVVGKQALPALPLPSLADDSALCALATLGRNGDLLILLAAQGVSTLARTLLADAGARGVLTIALTGPEADTDLTAHHHFMVQASDPFIVQETHEILYHVLWELVHVFFEHRAVTA